MSLSTISRTVVLNAAFLEEIKDSNADLWRQLAMLHELCQSHQVRSVLLHRLVGLLNDCRDSLALQFALEESYGFVDVPDGKATDLSFNGDHIRSQHCSLYLTVSELAEQAEELQYRGWDAGNVDALVRQVRQFELQLMEHEQAERRLLEHARNRSHNHV